ncbi:enoyl-CoA hydratase-related protein [Novosphingobium sp.]|uniref:enoyl-CoA hydratase-related protein n=1 Tax=Novosphingobium sp. TaxID=1874826 RepID=UPI0038B6DB03
MKQPPIAPLQIMPSTPILVGVGQKTAHWDGTQPEDAPSPQDLQYAAALAALADSGQREALAAVIDEVFVIRCNLDSVEGTTHPFGRCANPPATLARSLGISGARHVYSVVGGDQPQALVNEAAEAIHSGQARAVLIAGAEATGAMKVALKNRIKLDWSKSLEGPLEDRGLGSRLLSDYEIKNGLGAPTQTYPAFENALRARLGLNVEAHRQLMSELWETFSKVAADNPHAQFPQARSAAFLATESRENYKVADPYLKWHVAQDAVNQGAAVILTSVANAIAMGIPPENWVFLHGYSAAKDKPVTERHDLSRSQAIELALSSALASSGRSPADIDLFDLYSCFPCAVLLATESLGLDWREKEATVTGGLPFFGGPGNSYSLHAIATMTERLRKAPDTFGLILANGGFLSKEAVGVYSATPTTNWAPCSNADIQNQIDTTPAPSLLSTSCDAVVETFTITYRKGQPSRGYVIARTDQGRILARVHTGHRATLTALSDSDPIGTKVSIVNRDGVNYLRPDDAIGFPPSGTGLARRFDDILVERRGPVLEVTLNRPERMNALHSAVHFALHEVWDEYEADPDLWVAIITGAGDRAFCSGNDLKVTAKGGDMSIPPSGFAGLCNRFGRTKPVIAAVNGVAMGGGLEIALACDLVMADTDATFALPEVKVGLFAAAGGVHRLTQQIGRKAAMDLIITGRTINSNEAAALGIINEQVPSGTCLERARELAATITLNSPTAIRASLEAINQLEATGLLKTALEANGKIFGRLMRTRDFKEGVTAFAEKRKPEWRGA